MCEAEEEVDFYHEVATISEIKIMFIKKYEKLKDRHQRVINGAVFSLKYTNKEELLPVEHLVPVVHDVMCQFSVCVSFV